MKGKKLCSVLIALCLAVGGALPVSAATRSQNAAVFEAEEYAFYYPASDAEFLHDGHGNFTVSGLTGGAISSDDFFTTVITPETGSGGLAMDSSGYPVAPSSWQGASSSGSAAGSTMFTVPEGTQLGTLTIRGRSIRVYEGTTDSNLLKGAGHFPGTSAWDGNVCLCGHNRGANAWFSDLIRLTPGEQITYQTPLGVRTYQVTGTRIVSVNDLSPLTGSVENQLTLVTCVANQPDVRLIVTAKQVL